ncbi:MAG: DUF1214 domain-containing protein [Planctomycetota bacterium]|jgi:hypothetical protein
MEQTLNELPDAHSMFFCYARMKTPAMVTKMAGTGSQHAMAAADSDGNVRDGGKTYKLTFPPNVPARDFWSIITYDNETPSMPQTEHQFPGLNSQRDVEFNKYGRTDIYFGPKVPEGKESTWIQTVPGKARSVVLRFYGPLESRFDRTWWPPGIEPRRQPAYRASRG